MSKSKRELKEKSNNENMIVEEKWTSFQSFSSNEDETLKPEAKHKKESTVSSTTKKIPSTKRKNSKPCTEEIKKKKKLLRFH